MDGEVLQYWANDIFIAETSALQLARHRCAHEASTEHTGTDVLIKAMPKYEVHM